MHDLVHDGHERNDITNPIDHCSSDLERGRQPFDAIRYLDDHLRVLNISWLLDSVRCFKNVRGAFHDYNARDQRIERLGEPRYLNDDKSTRDDFQQLDLAVVE